MSKPDFIYTLIVDENDVVVDILTRDLTNGNVFTEINGKKFGDVLVSLGDKVELIRSLKPPKEGTND